MLTCIFTYLLTILLVALDTCVDRLRTRDNESARFPAAKDAARRSRGQTPPINPADAGARSPVAGATPFSAFPFAG